MDERAELQRIERLYTLGILDTKEDLTLRNFAEQALSVVPGASFAAVSLVDRQRQWFQTVIGMDVRETPREVSFCAHTIETAGVMVVEDASKDDRFAGNPLVTQLPGNPLLRRHQAHQRDRCALRHRQAAPHGRRRRRFAS